MTPLEYLLPASEILIQREECCVNRPWILLQNQDLHQNPRGSSTRGGDERRLRRGRGRCRGSWWGVGKNQAPGASPATLRSSAPARSPASAPSRSDSRLSQ